MTTAIMGKETLLQWLRFAPLFVTVGIFAVVILHVAFNLTLTKTLAPVGVLVLIQLAMYVSMFWLRRRFKHTGNPRPGIGAFGAYCLIMGLAAFHYGTELRFVSVRRSEYLPFSVVVVAATLILVAFNPKWKVHE